MFDFLFKRATKSPAVSPSTPVPAPNAAAHAARDAARVQAEALAQDESASVDFLLTCEFADARLIAAQSIHSKEALQRVLKSVRNSDRRVARLMQSRLDNLQTEKHTLELATRCIADAQILITQQYLTAQQVGAIDHRWTALFGVSAATRAELISASATASFLETTAELRRTFAAVRTTLAERLARQVELQRSVIDMLAALQNVGASANIMTTDDLHTTLIHHDAELVRCSAAFEAANLPKNLLDQCRVALSEAQTVVAHTKQREVANAAVMEQLHDWESVSAHTLDVARLQQDWYSASTHLLPEDNLSVRFQALLALVISTKSGKTPEVVTGQATSPTEFIDALHSLEQALIQGQLQLALEADRRLRTLSQNGPESAGHKIVLSGLRARLSQLQSWARWGGNVSRDELLKMATTLPAHNVGVIELAKKIGNLRAQWKTMDASAGPATQEHWHAFDVACTAAYAPVAAHHQALAEARQKNSASATAQIVALEQIADQFAATAAPDWKAISQQCRRAQQDWQRLGPIDRRDKQSLTQRFQQALQRLSQPLAAIQKAEQQHREQLITNVSKLQADDHRTSAALRALQQQWQERAKAIPLDHQAEQVLWLRFRAACDAIFAQRKERAVVEGQQWQTNLREREALCSTLELADTQSIDSLRTAVREVSAAWNAAGAVPRAAQDAIEQRYRRASEAVKKNIDTLQHASGQVRQQNLRHKLRLCQQLEAVLGGSSDTTSDSIESLTAEWQTLLATSTALDHVLAHRFEQALQAQRIGDHDYLEKLKSNGARLGSELTRLEILLSLTSPPERAGERLQLQVEVLQAALREGTRKVNHARVLAKLCTLPAIVDTADALRFEHIIAYLLDAENSG